MTDQTGNRPVDAPTFALTAAVLVVAISAITLALTGIGLASALVAIGICRFFGRPHLAFGLLAIATALLAFSLSQSPYPNVWMIAFPAYWATLARGTFPAVTALIWLDPTELAFDRLALIAVGMMAGGAFELVAHGRRNSRLTILQRNGGTPPVRRAPIAHICAWLAPRMPASFRRNYTLIGSHLAVGFWLWFSDADANHHVGISGSTGKGKTVVVSNFVEASIRRGQPSVFVDGKGDEEFAERVRKFATGQGRPVYIFNTLNLQNSCAYNPLAYGDYTARADRIMKLREWTEPHYESLAKAFLQTAFKALEFENRSVDLVQLADVLSVNALLRIVGRRGFSDPKRQALVKEINEHAAAEKNAIDGLRADIRFLTNSSLGVLFDTERARREGRQVLNLADARREGAVVYFVLPPLMFQNAAKVIGQLVINDLKAVATSSRSIWKLFFDEFSVFSSANVLNLVNMGRTFGVCGVLSTQSLADFDAGAPELGSAFGRQVRASINTMICFQTNDPDDADVLGRWVGTIPDIELTAQLQGDTAFTGLASARATRQFRVHPDDLKNLPKGRAYVVNKNNGTAALIAVRKGAI